MTTDLHSLPAQTESAALPPARAFGETNTLTLDLRALPAACGGSVVHLGDAQALTPGDCLRVVVFPAEPLALTITF
jgi:hypothetical protein